MKNISSLVLIFALIIFLIVFFSMQVTEGYVGSEKEIIEFKCHAIQQSLIANVNDQLQNMQLSDILPELGTVVSIDSLGRVKMPSTATGNTNSELMTYYSTAVTAIETYIKQQIESGPAFNTIKDKLISNIISNVGKGANNSLNRDLTAGGNPVIPI